MLRTYMCGMQCVVYVVLQCELLRSVHCFSKSSIIVCEGLAISVWIKNSWFVSSTDHTLYYGMLQGMLFMLIELTVCPIVTPTQAEPSALKLELLME